jgi:hypothetical protein
VVTLNHNTAVAGALQILAGVLLGTRTRPRLNLLIRHHAHEHSPWKVTEARAKAWCLLIHAEASLSLFTHSP